MSVINQEQSTNVVNTKKLNNDQKLWLISLSSFLSLPNHYKLNSLLNESDHFSLERIQSDNLRILNNSYDVKDKEDFIETLDVFCNTGRSQDFLYFMKEYSKPDQLDKLLNERRNNESISIWACHYSIVLSCSGIKAFDIGRYAFLCRCAYTVGLITEEEAWTFLIRVGKMAQNLFLGWQEFATSYAVGRCTWLDIKINDTEDTYGIIETIYKESIELEQILSDDEHPWSKLDWDIAL